MIEEVMKLKGLILLFVFASAAAHAQVCTINLTGNHNWNNATNYACQEGGTRSGKAVIVIPAGLNMNFNDNGDSWTGMRIDVYGTLTISKNVTIYSSIVVKSGGLLDITGKLDLGPSGNCGFTMVIENGGLLDVGGSSNRLGICNIPILTGGTALGCTRNYNNPPPYCEPDEGFKGPLGFERGGYNGTLPVTWLSFAARNLDNKSVYLSWSTATEANAESFIIERSMNGKTYLPIGSISASGNSQARNDYSFTDRHPFMGRTYYRLRQVDFDGTSSYSDIRFADVDGSRSVSVFPNPLEKDELNIQLNFSDENEVFVSVYDMTGHKIDQFSFFGSAFSKPLNLRPGTYMLRANAGRENLVCRFVVN